MKEEIKQDIINSAYVVLSDVENSLKVSYGNDYYTLLKNIADGYALYAEDFILSFSKKDLMFYLTFTVGRHGYVISDITMNLIEHINPHEIKLMQDHYYDVQENVIVYGADAINTRQRDLLVSTGRAKCPICDKIYDNEHMKQNGFCINCDSTRHKIMWN